MLDIGRGRNPDLGGLGAHPVRRLIGHRTMHRRRRQTGDKNLRVTRHPAVHRCHRVARVIDLHCLAGKVHLTQLEQLPGVAIQ